MGRLGIRRALIAVTVGTSVLLGSTASNAAATVNGHAVGVAETAPVGCVGFFYTTGGITGVGAVTVGTNAYGPVFAMGTEANGYACGATHGTASVLVNWSTSAVGSRYLRCSTDGGSYTVGTAAGGIRQVKVTATLPCTRNPGAPFTGHVALTYDVLPVPGVIPGLPPALVTATLK